MKSVFSFCLFVYLCVVNFPSMVFCEDSEGKGEAFLDANTILERWEANYGNPASLKFKGRETIIHPPSHLLMKNRHRFTYEEMIRDGKRFCISYLHCQDEPSTIDPNHFSKSAYNGSTFKSLTPIPTDNGVVHSGSIYPNTQLKKVKSHSLLNIYLRNTKIDLALDDYPNGIPILSMEIMDGMKKKIVTVRPECEQVAGIWCHVIDINEINILSYVKSYWFAHDRGMLLMRYESLEDGELDSLLEVQEIAKIDSGQGTLWYPKRAIRRYAPIGRMITWQLDVDMFETNIEISPEMFEIEFPQGTIVDDWVEKVTYQQGIPESRTPLTEK